MKYCFPASGRSPNSFSDASSRVAGSLRSATLDPSKSGTVALSVFPSDTLMATPLLKDTPAAPRKQIGGLGGDADLIIRIRAAVRSMPALMSPDLMSPSLVLTF